ncbi:MAG: malto-oligosyltrehalose trehalohydrolase [Alkalispirochaeta sp.]
MTSSFTSTFGPEEHGEDRRIFRLWAPSATSVSLELLRGDRLAEQVEMKRSDGGGSYNAEWYRSEVLDAPAGTRYAFRINGDLLVPDPASRMQDSDVHGYSVVVGSSPADTSRWRNHPWHATVIYEAHVGTATPRGTFASLQERLPYLADLGVTVLELLPAADFPGPRNWGYDGVLPFAPDRSYGSPGDLKALVNAAHDHGIAVWMDVVYNHFGPDGNYLHVYCDHFFSESIPTPWGAGIDFSQPLVRRFFIENALYWIHEFGIDGLRLDAVHAIHDSTEPHILTELSKTVRDSLPAHRHVHLVLENDANQARFLRSPAKYEAQWNDDIHHVLHVLLTGENHGYYRDFARDTDAKLLRALTEGYVFQGERSSAHNGTPRGEVSRDLSTTKFISFLQNHDQIGNRAWGDRLAALTDPAALAAAEALLLLSPQIPMIFMGEEWHSTTPFLFFCAFEGELAQAVRDGRRREFGLDDLPDPGAPETFTSSVLETPGDSHRYRELLHLRRTHLQPLLPAMRSGTGGGGGSQALSVRYPSDGTLWCIDVNLSDRSRPRREEPFSGAHHRRKAIYRSSPDRPWSDVMGPWSIDVWSDVL